MAGKITLEFTKGELEGKKFVYADKERIYIGRQDDCAIVVPEGTVSRYHCMLEITPPNVKLQDFGSLNGTYLNGKMIGRRARDKSWEEAKDEQHDVFELHDGDTLGLGKRCELKCYIEAIDVCAECGAPLPKGIKQGFTVPDDDERAIMRYNGEGERICESCYRKAEGERERNEAKQTDTERMALEFKNLLVGAPEAKARKCAVCGNSFMPESPDQNLCPTCTKNQSKEFDNILAVIGIGMKQADEAAKKPDDAADAPVIEGYDMAELLGKGGMGEVWKVRERSTGKYYALKTMLPEAAVDPHSKKIFLREARIGEVLRHKNVVRTYRSGYAGGVFYILMDLCEGGTAFDLMGQHGGKLPMTLATWIILQALSGLDYVHNVDLDVEIKKGVFGGTKEVNAKGAVHRDFKPENIFLSDKSDKPVAMVADFGMAKAFDTAGLSNVSKTDMIAGTALLMPRQQAMCSKYAKPEVDVWSAAGTYYNMLTGHLPKDFPKGKNIFQVIVEDDAIPIREREPSIPARLAEVIDRALVEEPELYYKTAAELRRDIVEALPEDVRRAVQEVI